MNTYSYNNKLNKQTRKKLTFEAVIDKVLLASPHVPLSCNLIVLVDFCPQKQKSPLICSNFDGVEQIVAPKLA